MFFTVKNVVPLDDYKLQVFFEDNTEKIIDMKPYLDQGIFSALRDRQTFSTAKVTFGTVEWDNGLDIDPEFLYEYGEIIEETANLKR